MIQKRTTRKRDKPAQTGSVVETQAIYRMIGLARRAGRVIGGTDAVDKAIRQQQARLVIVASDAAGRTCRQIEQTASHDRIAVTVFGEKQQLGHWTGSVNRAVLAIVDTHFALRLHDMIKQAADVPVQVNKAAAPEV
ncbi:MAG: ribosomal L7Ae/L30e/S12e/Gadd45 family protein [Bacillota bacterium]|nr:ribosomal L7Ae/L30e/S12e/Gadd45 family protein [Bacillota bacterium]